MSDAVHCEKSAPSAPPYYSINPTNNSETPQYGFQITSQPVQQYPPYAGNQSVCPPYYHQQGFQQYQPGYGPFPQTTQPTQPAQPNFSISETVIIGGCPTCRVGILEDGYTCCGILCAICFFPIGILCCLAMKEKRCTNCSSTF